jgi:5-bromo-4-chloroindolyl phosphate hydrolysis protein
MAQQRFGGRYSRGSRPGQEAGAPPVTGAEPFRNLRARRVSIRARLMFLYPLPLLVAALGAIGRGRALETLAEIGGFVGLMLSAWLLNEGLRAEAAYDARQIARPPSIPRKLFAAGLTGLGVALVGWLSIGQPLPGAIIFGLLAGGAQGIAFGLDPMRKKGFEGADAFESDRVARAIDRAEAMVREIIEASRRIGDRMLEGRVERLCGQAREVFRTVEADPRDLPRARRFLSVYLMGLRDATQKFADIWGRSRDPKARTDYEALLADLETSFAAHRTDLLRDDRSDLDIEIEVLRERLRQDGLTAA